MVRTAPAKDGAGRALSGLFAVKISKTAAAPTLRLTARLLSGISQTVYMMRIAYASGVPVALRALKQFFDAAIQL